MAAQQGAELFGHGEGDEEVGDGKELRRAAFAPRGGRRSPALRTRTMAARERRDGEFAASAAHTAHDAAKLCATSKDGLRRLCVGVWNGRAVFHFIRGPVQREDLGEGDFYRQFAHARSFASAAWERSSPASVRCKYTIVVSKLLCPRYALMLFKLTPSSRRCVA